MDLDSDIVTLADIEEAYEYLKSYESVKRTPTLQHVQNLFVSDRKEDVGDEIKADKILNSIDLYLKMENMQTTGSFKIRGCANQMRKLKKEDDGGLKLVTYSGGNYGKAFAYRLGRTGVDAVCLMPDTVPSNRVDVVKGYGVDVKLVPSSCLMAELDKFESKGYRKVQSFDDVDMIAGNASVGMELLEEVPDPDIVLVCCGGGGLVSGVAAAISLSGVRNCRVYAVEPEGAPSMYESFKSRRAVTLSKIDTIASGLSPPHAGAITYKHCRWFVEDVLLVSDKEILSTMRLMFNRGIKAELSGCAAMAALLTNKVPDVTGKKVAVIVTGGNVTCNELNKLIPNC